MNKPCGCKRFFIGRFGIVIFGRRCEEWRDFRDQERERRARKGGGE